MISLQRDPSAELLKSYLPPFKGTWKTLPPYLIPDDSVQDASNVSLMGGKLRSRCGLEIFDSGNLGDKVLGSFLTTDTTKSKFAFCSTRNKVYRFFSGSWNDITGIVTLTASNNNQMRFSSLQLGSYVYIVYANGVDTLKVIPQSTYTLENITPHSGTIPVLTDVCTSFSRFVGITPPYTVQWCDVINDSYLSYTNWPALNQVILADTEDALVAIRPLGTLGIAVYKEGNIFVGFAQSGPNSQAFRFEHRGEYEGPAGVNAIVNVNGTHMYMTPTGRIGLFDGTQQAFIADGIWPFLQDDLDITYAYRIFGVHNYKTAEVTFYYPRIGDSGALKGLITIDLPFPLAGVQSFAYFLGTVAFDCTNGLSIRLFNSSASALIFGSSTFRTFVLNKNIYTDDSTAFTCSFQTGLFKPPKPEMPTKDKSDIYRPIIELYSTRDSTRGLLDITGVTSNTLESDGTNTINETIDLTQTPINEYIGFNETGSFLGANFEWPSTAKFEYKGVDIYGRAST